MFNKLEKKREEININDEKFVENKITHKKYLIVDFHFYVVSW